MSIFQHKIRLCKFFYKFCPHFLPYTKQMCYNLYNWYVY